MATTKKKSEELAIVEEFDDKIYIFRGQRVMLDADLAKIYGVTTKRLNEQLRRNAGRFPENFVFQLNDKEFESLRSQLATSNKARGGRRYSPYVFTEHGAVMLASVLNSPTAVEASIVVIRAFVKMRAMLALHQDLADRVEQLEKVTDYHGQKFGAVSSLLSEIMRDPKYLKRKIGFVETKKKKK
jgi:hypothetical protein